MKARVKWIEKRSFLGHSGSGHGVLMSASAGEESLGPSPMEMVLLGLGGCSSFDVVNILEKMREPIEDCTATLEAERADDAPRVFTRIHLRFVVTGRGLDPEKVERAVTMSAEKYCSVSVMLAKTAEITHEIEVREAAG
jgi:putative redox protein